MADASRSAFERTFDARPFRPPSQECPFHIRESGSRERCVVHGAMRARGHPVERGFAIQQKKEEVP